MDAPISHFIAVRRHVNKELHARKYMDTSHAVLEDSCREQISNGMTWGSPTGDVHIANNKDVLVFFWLFPCVWEEGCDNCYLEREQRKHPHQGRAGHPQAGETPSSWTNTSHKRQTFICCTKPESFKSSISTLCVLLYLLCFSPAAPLHASLLSKYSSVAFSSQKDARGKHCLVISPDNVVPH